jgi:protein AIR1/2
MTSTAVLEIIDLTDAQSPINDDTQNMLKPETRETDANPDKSAARAVRKRKNGEAGGVRSSHPVESPPRVSIERDRVQSGEGTESRPAEDAQGKDGESARKKKRRSKKTKDKDKDSAPSSREDTRRDALLALDDDKLFFIDSEPTSVRAGMTFVLNDDAKAAQPSAQTSEVDKVPLLLPAHVSVLDTGKDLPVQIVQPADSDSDAESYIDFLDYDDRLVRLPLPRVNSALAVDLSLIPK